PQEYLNRLADAAEEWFEKRPEDAAGLAVRLHELRGGCSRVILTRHEPLGGKDREWLHEGCRERAGKVEEHLTAPGAGQDTAQGRAAADGTVRNLVKALRGKAADRQAV